MNQMQLPKCFKSADSILKIAYNLMNAPLTHSTVCCSGSFWATVITLMKPNHEFITSFTPFEPNCSPHTKPPLSSNYPHVNHRFAARFSINRSSHVFAASGESLGQHPTLLTIQFLIPSIQLSFLSLHPNCSLNRPEQYEDGVGQETF